MEGDEAAAASRLDAALPATGPFDGFARHVFGNVGAVLYALVPRSRAFFDDETTGPDLQVATDVGRALVALREHDSTAPAARLPWEDLDRLRTWAYEPHLAELALAAMSHGVMRANVALVRVAQRSAWGTALCRRSPRGPDRGTRPRRTRPDPAPPGADHLRQRARPHPRQRRVTTRPRHPADPPQDGPRTPAPARPSETAAPRRDRRTDVAGQGRTRRTQQPACNAEPPPHAARERHRRRCRAALARSLRRRVARALRQRSAGHRCVRVRQGGRGRSTRRCANGDPEKRLRTVSRRSIATQGHTSTTPSIPTGRSTSA